MKEKDSRGKEKVLNYFVGSSQGNFVMSAYSQAPHSVKRELSAIHQPELVRLDNYAWCGLRGQENPYWNALVGMLRPL